MTPPELFKNMPLLLSVGMLDHAYQENKPLYRELVNALAQVRRTRPVAILKNPRAERHPWMVAMLQQPGAISLAFQVISDWLLLTQQTMLKTFLDTLSIPHDGHGSVDQLPPAPSKATLENAVALLLQSHPPEQVAVYLHAFNHMPEAHWPDLDAILAENPALQLRGALADLPSA